MEPNAPSKAKLPRSPAPATAAPRPSSPSVPFPRRFRPSSCLPLGPALSRRNPPPFPFHSSKLAANQRRGNVRPPARSGPPPACPAPFLRMQRKERRRKRRESKGGCGGRGGGGGKRKRRRLQLQGKQDASMVVFRLLALLPARPPLPSPSISLSLSLSHSDCGLIAAKPIHRTRTHSLRHSTMGLVCLPACLPGDVANEYRLQWEHWQEPTTHPTTDLSTFPQERVKDSLASFGPNIYRRFFIFSPQYFLRSCSVFFRNFDRQCTAPDQNRRLLHVQHSLHSYCVVCVCVCVCV